MSGVRPRYFTVSEALQAILDKMENLGYISLELLQKGIRKLHHFHFSSSNVGVVHVKESIHAQEVAISILKSPVHVSTLTSALLPPEITPAGLTHDINNISIILFPNLFHQTLETSHALILMFKLHFTTYLVAIAELNLFERIVPITATPH